MGESERWRRCCCSHLHARATMKVRHAAGPYRARRERSLFCFLATSIDAHGINMGKHQTRKLRVFARARNNNKQRRHCLAKAGRSTLSLSLSSTRPRDSVRRKRWAVEVTDATSINHGDNKNSPSPTVASSFISTTTHWGKLRELYTSEKVHQ